jgi:hypothetical protein
LSSPPKKENPTFYAVIPAFVRYDKSLSPSAKLLYGEITALSDRHGYCFASNKYFANVYGVDKSSITHWIKQLADKGYIRQEFIYAEDKPIITERRIFIADFSPLKESLDQSVVIQELPEPNNGEEGGEIIHQGGEKTHHGVVKKLNGGGEKTPEIILQANITRAAAAVDQIRQVPEKPPTEEAATAPPVVSRETIDKLKLHFTSLDKNLFFDRDFYPKVLLFLSENGLTFDYVSWMYYFCSQKNVGNLSGYLFKALCEPRYVEFYIRVRNVGKPAEEEPVSLVTCPVCDTKFSDSVSSCPCCFFFVKDHGNRDKVEYQKKLFNMPADVRDDFDEEMANICAESSECGDFSGLALRKKALDQKYGLA